MKNQEKVCLLLSSFGPKTYSLLRNLSSTTKPSYLVYDLVSILKNHLQPWNFIVGEIASTMERAKQDVPILFTKQIYWTGCTVLKTILISEKHKEVHTYLFLLWETWTSQTKFKGYTSNNRFMQFLKFNSQSKWLNKYCSIWG